jgi:hypothetical protein
MEQSASLPGKPEISNPVFFRESSLAFLAASLASAALKHFSIIFFAIEGF